MIDFPNGGREAVKQKKKIRDNPRIVGGTQLAVVLMLLALIVVVALAAVGCSPAHSAHINATDKAQAKSDAKALSKCLPASAIGQLELVKSLETKSGRIALEAKCGIPPAKRQATEAEILNAAEHGHLTRPGGVKTFMEVTLPAIIERNQA